MQLQLHQLSLWLTILVTYGADLDEHTLSIAALNVAISPHASSMIESNLRDTTCDT